MYAWITLASCQWSASRNTRAPESAHFKFAIIYVAASPLVSQAARECPCQTGTNSPTQWGRGYAGDYNQAEMGKVSSS